MSYKTEFSRTEFIGQTMGVVTGTFLLSQFPSVPGSVAKLKARSANPGSFFVGTVETTGTFPLPWELDASEETDWFSIDGNLNTLYQRGSSGTSYLTYWVLR